MGMQELTEKILADAAKEAAQTLQNARDRARQAQQDSSRRMESYEDSIMQAAIRDADEAYERAIKMAQLDMRKQLLATKRARLDDAFAEAMKKLVSMPEKQKREFFQTLLSRYAQGGEELLASPGERAIFSPDFLKPFGVTLSGEDAPGTGGFVLRKGGVAVDCTYEAMSRAMRDEIEPEAARVLFAALEEEQG